MAPGGPKPHGELELGPTGASACSSSPTEDGSGPGHAYHSEACQVCKQVWRHCFWSQVCYDSLSYFCFKKPGARVCAPCGGQHCEWILYTQW